MGCGGSRLDPSSDMIPAKLRPLLRRRFEEMKRRRNGGQLKDSALSKKELLNSDEDSSFQSNSPERDNYHDRKSASSDREDSMKVAPEPEPSSERIIKDIEVDKALEKPMLNVPPKAATNPEFAQNKPMEAPLQASPTSPKVAPLTGSAPESDTNSNKQNDVETANAMAGVEVVETKDGGGEDKEEDEEGGLPAAEGRYICPGSPSFRVFLLDSPTNANDDDKDDDTDKVLQSEGSGENVESVNSNEDSVKKTEKTKQQGKKGRRFRKVMHVPKARAGAVKNLLHVNMKSCYNPACSGGRDNGCLLSKKVT